MISHVGNLPMNKDAQFNILGVKIADLNISEVVEAIHALIKTGGKHLVVTANPEIILAAHKDPSYKKILQQASLVLADGIGLVLASYVLGAPLKKGRVTGVDLIWELAKLSQNNRLSLFLAGSTQAVLDKTTHNLASVYTNMNINGSYSLVSDSKLGVKDAFGDNEESDQLKAALNQSSSDILLLAFGHPKQEKWIAANLPEINVSVAIGVGGAFDIISNQLRRAPHILRSIGMEWLWRLILEPRRIVRIYQATVVFPVLVLKLLISKVLRGT